MNELEGDLSYLSRSTLQYRIKIQKIKNSFLSLIKRKKELKIEKPRFQMKKCKLKKDPSNS
jgi:hypothetical protein